MQQFWDKLSGICHQYPLTKKILVMPSLSSGAILLRTFSLKGNAYLNLQVNTVAGLVASRLETVLTRQGLQLISGVPAERKVCEILEEFAAKDRLAYFDRLKITPSVSGMMWQALMELKEASFTPEQLDDEIFVNPAKGVDLRLIYEAYEARLQGEKLLDRADLLSFYLEEMSAASTPAGDYRLIVPANLRVTPLEKKVLDGWLAKGRGDYLPLPEISNPAPPSDYYASAGNGENIGSGFSFSEDSPSFEHQSSRLAAAYSYDARDPGWEKSSGDGLPQINFFHAYGESAEVKEILRIIKSNRLNFEDVVIYYTEKDLYSGLFWKEGLRCGIPISFGEGVGISCFRPGRLLDLLMEWIRQDYAVSVLYLLLSSENFKYNADGGPGKIAVARKLRSSPIGWSRERYEKWIEEVNSEEAEFANREEEPDYEHLTKRALRDVLAELLDKIPGPDADGEVEAGKLAAGLADVVESRGAVAGKGDGRAGKLIKDTLQQLADAGMGKTSLEEALDWIERLVTPLRVAKSGPEPGTIHITGYHSGIWISRKHVFLSGLDARRFPGQGIEEPVFLDAERDRLGSLSRAGNRPTENIYEMLQLLSARESDSSRITLSFASYDTEEQRDTSPSSLILQIYRLSSGEAAASYGDFMDKLGTSRAMVPAAEEKCMGKDDWWMHRILKKKETRELAEKVRQVYPELVKGQEAIEQRKSFDFTPYEGVTSPVEPLWKDGMSMSASRLEKLAKCPYSYFVENVLWILPPEEIVYDTTSWLDEAQRGLLLHSIFEEFHRELLRRGEEPDYNTHLEFLEDLARRCMKEKKEELPPPHRVVYWRESEEILESCRFFLMAETQNRDLGVPTYLELCFGIKGTKNTGLDEDLPPARIDLNSGHYFYLRGKIDRVDYREESGDYLVIDYKTGSTYVFEPQDVFRGGRRLQPILYGLALEKTLQEQGISKSPVIGGCGYYFPTSRGRGQMLLTNYRRWLNDFYRIMEFLRKVLEKGFFLMTDDPDEDCTFCDYSSLCDRSAFNEILQKKIASSEDEIPSRFREIRKIK